MSNAFASLEKSSLLSRKKGKGQVWTLTPKGRSESVKLISDLDLAALEAEMQTEGASELGHTTHPTIPPELAPPELIQKVREFLETHPFDRSVFGMTRFPDEQEEEKGRDPVGPALEIAKDVCDLHSLSFHLADDQFFSDDLWTNVAGHMWASRYGIAFFEDRRDRGMNYNLTIEVGSMMMSGRRCALLKDRSIDTLPTDLVGRIRKDVDLDDLESVEKQLHAWMKKDLGLGACKRCS